MRTIWNFADCNVDVRVGALARCKDLDVTLSDSTATPSGFHSQFYSCMKAMSEHSNKYGVHFLHAVSIPFLFPNIVDSIFFSQGKMQMQCVKKYI